MSVLFMRFPGGKRVHNPTAVTLYFAINKVEDYKVEPGETIEVD